MTGDRRFNELRRTVPGVSRETFEDLIGFEALFRKWAPSINLAASSTLEALWTRHILDSAQLVALKPDARMWLDLGSGGGFPGLVVAILLKGRSDSHIDLVESAGKKAAFLRMAAGALHLPARVHQVRIEALGPEIGSPDLVTARALAPLPKLLGLAQRWLSDGSVGLFQKGRDYRVEVDASRYEWDFDLLEHPSITEPDAAILEVRELRRRRAGRQD